MPLYLMSQKPIMGLLNIKVIIPLKSEHFSKASCSYFIWGKYISGLW